MGSYDWDDEPFVKPKPVASTAQYVKPRDVRLTDVSQELMMRVGMWSLCNVGIQQYTEYGVLATKFRLFCSNCSKFELFDYGDFLNDFKFVPLLAKIETFSMKHRHEAVPSPALQVSSTRLFTRLFLVPSANADKPLPARRYRTEEV